VQHSHGVFRARTRRVDHHAKIPREYCVGLTTLERTSTAPLFTPAPRLGDVRRGRALVRASHRVQRREKCAAWKTHARREISKKRGASGLKTNFLEASLSLPRCIYPSGRTSGGARHQASRREAALPFQHPMNAIVYVDGFELCHTARRGRGRSCAY
jgi:hypothetical protein